MKFQAESKKSGDKFESLVLQDLKRAGNKYIKRHVVIPEIGVEADFYHLDSIGRKIYIEAKGGEAGENKRPGAKRTDNVKKAIANGALIKSFDPNSQFIIYFSDLPKHGSSSHKMINGAIRAGYVDAVRYLITII